MFLLYSSSKFLSKIDIYSRKHTKTEIMKSEIIEIIKNLDNGFNR